MPSDQESFMKLYKKELIEYSLFLIFITSSLILIVAYPSLSKDISQFLFDLNCSR